MIRRLLVTGTLFMATAFFATAASAHGGEETLSVEPASLAAGDTCVLAATGLEPNSERLLVLVGENMTIDMGSVMTDAEGAFAIELTIPGHLPAATYELQAIGDETLTTELTVTAAPGAVAPPPADEPVPDTILPRDRSALELGLIVLVALAAAGLGGFLVWRAERVGRAIQA